MFMVYAIGESKNDEDEATTTVVTSYLYPKILSSLCKAHCLTIYIDSAWEWRMSGLTRNGTAEPISRDQIISRR